MFKTLFYKLEITYIKIHNILLASIFSHFDKNIVSNVFFYKYPNFPGTTAISLMSKRGILYFSVC